MIQFLLNQICTEFEATILARSWNNCLRTCPISLPNFPARLHNDVSVPLLWIFDRMPQFGGTCTSVVRQSSSQIWNATRNRSDIEAEGFVTFLYTTRELKINTPLRGVFYFLPFGVYFLTDLKIWNLWGVYFFHWGVYFLMGCLFSSLGCLFWSVGVYFQMRQIHAKKSAFTAKTRIF